MNGHTQQTNIAIETLLQQHLGQQARLQQLDGASGGCINQAHIATLSDGSRWFIKQNQAAKLSMFQAEAAGLNAIRDTQTLYAPQPLLATSIGNSAYLVLEYLELDGATQAQQAGTQLAELHRHTQAQFGWQMDNTIGLTHQANRQHKDWVEFWQQQRLGFQLKLAQRNGYPQPAYQQGLRLQEKLGVFFTDYQPQASLLHGDLWGGNIAYQADGHPVVFDPAVYYGDREADLAMTELFGGFSPAFYAAYQATWPLDSGYAVRKNLYNLYHILNHFNLFGGSYAMQAANMTEALLAEC